jgi:DNA polymerase III epsilon subunit family exonuclease
MYCVIDFETTGLSPYESDVIEYAAVHVDDHMNLGECITSLCGLNTGKELPPVITKITGIEPHELTDKPPFEEHLQKLLDFIGDRTVVAHNIPFDMGFLRRYCSGAGLPVPSKTLCTIRLAKKCCPPPYKLEAVARSLSIKSDGYHRAEADARTTAKILIELLSML